MHEKGRKKGDIHMDRNNRTTAKIFREKEEVKDDRRGIKDTIRRIDVHTAKRNETSREKDRPGKKETRFSDEASSYSFPLNYLFEVQDWINESMSLERFVQLLVVCYLGQFSYFNYKSQILDKGNIFQCLGAGILVYILRLRMVNKKRIENKQEALQMPEFEIIHAIFLPMVGALVMNEDMVLLNALLSIDIQEDTSITLLLLSLIFPMLSYLGEYQYSKKLVVSILMHYFFRFILSKINSGGDINTVSEEVLEEDDSVDMNLVKKKDGFKLGRNGTLLTAEQQLICIMLTNLLFSLGTVDLHSLPLVVMQKLVISLLITMSVLYPFFGWYQKSQKIWFAGLLAVLFAVFFMGITNLQLVSLLNHDNAVLWLQDFIFSSEERIKILSIWVGTLVIGVPFVFFNSQVLSLNCRRKIWHLILVALLIYPSLPHQPQFTAISLLGAMVLFFIVEMVRYTRFTEVGVWLHESLLVFQDFKDLKGPLNLSYIFLISGVTLPFVFDYCILKSISIRSYMGIVALGFGDPLASFVGKRFGSIKWARTNKSLQGTISFILSCLLSLFLIERLVIPGLVNRWENVFVACILGGLIEGSCPLNDNLCVPCYMFVSMVVLEGRSI